MTTIANYIFILTCLMILVQMIMVVRFVLRCKSAMGTGTVKSDRTWEPKAAVVLCLRGADPSLNECLAALLDQDYEPYRVICVLDNSNDPAADVLNSYTSDPRVSILIAEPKIRSCSLKCNSLVTAFEGIQERFAVLVDADTIPDRNWLSDLIAPLKQTNVVATSGNRWFVPEDKLVGSLVRYFWNMAAAPQMDAYQVTWGGSLALRTSFVRSSGLLESWKRSLFEDASVTMFARKAGKEVQMLPHLLVLNRENISFSGATNWIRRQLLDTKLYHSCFSKVVLHCFSVAALLALVAMLLVVLMFRSEAMRPAIILCMCVVNYAVFYVGAWIVLEKTARDAIAKRGHSVPPISWTNLRALLVAMFAVLATQFAYSLATWKAIRTRRVTWRKIEYRIDGPQSIEMIEYQPMSHSENANRESI